MPSPHGTVALSSRILAAHGHDDLIWGHASCRDPQGRGAWLKSAEWGLAEVTAERVHLVSGDGEVLEGTGPRHSEFPIHTEIYAARSDVGGVVHTHPPYSIGLAASGQPLRPLSHAATMFVPPDVPVFDATSDLIRTAQLGKQLAAVLGGRPSWTGAEEASRKRRYLTGEKTISAVWDHLARSLKEAR
jgi:ribulose-5-phosphate 4-epimerase/fuculose-1-phosphate aldolase